MRVGIDISKALRRLDGIGRAIQGLVRGLMAVDRDNDYRLYPVHEPATAERFHEVFPEAPPNFVFTPERRPAAGEVDVFHATTYSVPHGLSARLVLTVYDLTFLTHPQFHTLTNRLHCLRGLARAISAGARLIAISRHTRQDLVRLLALDEAAIPVVYLAAEPRFAPPPAAEVRAGLAQRFGLTEPYVLSLGTVEPRKNLTTLMAAFERLPDQLRDTHLLVVAGAEGWLAADHRSLAAAAGVGDRVRWLGAVADADLPLLYAGAAAFAYPSLYEGFGLPPLEAMACGAPVVASNSSSLPEVVGEAAVLVDPTSVESVRDGLASVLADEALRRSLRAAGLARAAEFSWERTARETLAVYR